VSVDPVIQIQYETMSDGVMKLLVSTYPAVSLRMQLIEIAKFLKEYKEYYLKKYELKQYHKRTDHTDYQTAHMCLQNSTAQMTKTYDQLRSLFPNLLSDQDDMLHLYSKKAMEVTTEVSIGSSIITKLNAVRAIRSELTLLMAFVNEQLSWLQPIIDGLENPDAAPSANSYRWPYQPLAAVKEKCPQFLAKLDVLEQQFQACSSGTDPQHPDNLNVRLSVEPSARVSSSSQITPFNYFQPVPVIEPPLPYDDATPVQQQQLGCQLSLA
jgi:hypothetical protein